MNILLTGGLGYIGSDTALALLAESTSEGELYISHAIYAMMLDGDIFSIAEASDYVYWGTIDEYRQFGVRHVAVFCDVDGVLLENGSKFGNHGWVAEAIEANVEALKGLQQRESICLVLSTSRPESEREHVEGKLSDLGLRVDNFVGVLPHTKRMLINDFWRTNPYPTAISVNLARNSEDLAPLLSHVS